MATVQSYKKGEALGSGASGTVFACTWNGEACAVKQIVFDSGSHREDAEQAIVELTVLRMFAHANLIGFKGVVVDKVTQTVGIVIELADVHDLSTAIKLQRKEEKCYFTEAHVMYLFVQIALAVEALHSRRILHRDIKTSNIFLSSKGIVKLGDFGLAHVAADNWNGGGLRHVGTPYYLSPEMCRNEDYAEPNDVWALGVVLYELFTLSKPFKGRNMVELATVIATEKPRPIPLCFSKQASQLVKQLLTKAVSERPTIHDVLQLPYVCHFADTYKQYLAAEGIQLGGPLAVVDSVPEDVAKAMTLLRVMYKTLPSQWKKLSRPRLSSSQPPSMVETAPSRRRKRNERTFVTC